MINLCMCICVEYSTPHEIIIPIVGLFVDYEPYFVVTIS